MRRLMEASVLVDIDKLTAIEDHPTKSRQVICEQKCLAELHVVERGFSAESSQVNLFDLFVDRFACRLLDTRCKVICHRKDNVVIEERKRL